MRYILSLLILSTFLLAFSFTSHITVEDKNHSLTKEDILYDRFENFSSITKHAYSKSAFWTKETIQNSSNQKVDLMFRNLRSGTDFIDVFIYDGDTLLATYLLGDQRVQEERTILSTKSVFYQGLEPLQKLTIITKYVSFGSFDLYWEALPLHEYSKINGIENIFYGIFGGVVFTLVLYNLILYFSLLDKAILYYVIQGFFVGWFVYAVNGMWYLLDLGIGLEFITASTWFAPTLMLLFILLFIKEFFQLSKINQKLSYVLYTIIGILCLFFLILLYGYFSDFYIFTLISPLFLNFTFLVYIVILAIAFWGIMKKFDGAIYIFVGQFLYLFSLVYFTFVLSGNINSSFYTYFIIPFGVLTEMIFFSLAIGTKIKKIKQDFENTKLLSLQEEQYTQYGKIVGNISHQWKQPLSFLSSSIMYLQTLKTLHKEDKIKDEFLCMAPKLNYTIETMVETIDLFNNFYKDNRQKTVFSLKEELERMIKMYEYKLLTNHINIDLMCDENLQINTYKISFIQIFMILFNNTIEEYEKQEREKPIISLQIVKEKDTIIIVFSDNAGGIKDIQKAFSLYFTTKENGQGIGLYILQTIVKEKFHGKIEVVNKDDGATFYIRLPL